MSVPVPAAEILAVAQEYYDAGRIDAAERMARHVLAAQPDRPEALHLCGLAAYRRGRLEEAGALVARAVEQGGAPIYWRNLSEIRRTQARLDEALGAARHAVSRDPADPLGLFQLAMVLYDRQELPACIATARAALQLRPGLPEAHMKLAQALLASGEMDEGWREYEWRWRIPGAPPPVPATDRPQWDGTPTGARLLLVADQGYGDAVMFARYLPWVLARARDVVVAASAEMHALLRAIQPGLTLVAQWEDATGFAAWCPFSTLPLLHGTQLATIPGGVPYLPADGARAAMWKARLDAQPAITGLRRIGLAWAGRPTHNNDFNRSVPLAALAPLAAVPGVAFISLQKGPAAAQGREWPGPAPLLDLDGAGFEDTAAIIAGLDLVISVDTAVVHLAGAMGRPCWVMLPFAADWRWLTGRPGSPWYSNSPWYPSLRLFRPDGPRDWPGLVAQVAQALAMRQPVP